jgi:thiol-disulfide isomerase/thioredoxin
MTQKILLASIFSLFVILLSGSVVLAEQTQQIDFFYSETCPFCLKEKSFLDDLKNKYPDLIINFYSLSNGDNVNLLKEKLIEKDAIRDFGTVPITFVGDKLFLGFDNKEGIGAKIIEASGITENIDNSNPENNSEIYIPFMGEVNVANYSLPMLAMFLGTLDGFNICSLGALVLILGLSLMLGSRKKIALYGGIFLITTALIYAFLIFLWFKLFSTISTYVVLFEFLIGAIGVAGGVYFFREYFRMKRFGVTCDSSGLPIIGKFSRKIQKAFEEKGGILAIIGGVIIFAAVITIVEFPCSAAIPVMFAGLLADAGVSEALYISYLSIYIVFYLLDEIIVFTIAVLKMSIWLTSPKFVKGVTLVEGITLLFLGLFYVSRLLA